MYFIPAALLLGILALLIPGVQRFFQDALKQRPALLFAIPATLSALFLIDAAQLGAFNIPLAALILAYTFLPTICAYLSWADFVIIALLWFPLEFSAGRQWVPKQAQAPLHLAAYGVSILLGLSIF